MHSYLNIACSLLGAYRGKKLFLCLLLATAARGWIGRSLVTVQRGLR